MGTERLTCKLTNEERDARAHESTVLVKDYKAIEDRKSLTAKTLGAELKELRAKMEEASRAARDGHEEREVEVETRVNVMDYTIETWRLDTGELVRVRAMTDEERTRHRQQRLRGLD
ncbi:MAG: hypothetical protein R3A48_28585 [Polyangiales bacterium]